MRKFLLAFSALVMCATGIAVGDYAATQGSGTTFGSAVVGGVHYVRNFLCDPTTVTQCAVVNSSGVISATVTNANANGQATMANSSPVVIASNQTAVPVTLTSTTITGTAAVTQSGTWTTGQTSPYPATAVPYTATNVGTTAATTATLAGAASVTTYICGFSIRANATAAATNNATVTGVITATLNFTQWTAPLTSGLGITEMIFAPCIPASGTNQSIAVVSGAPGSGGTVSVTAWGYKL